jgi:hypothetical protein
MPLRESRFEPVKSPGENAVVVEAVARAFELWGLAKRDAAALFDVSESTWARMKSGAYRGTLDRDKAMRASLLIGIFKALRLLFDGPLTYGWPTAPNAGPLFGGRTPVQAMIEGGIPTIALTRQHLDALRGGL